MYELHKLFIFAILVLVSGFYASDAFALTEDECLTLSNLSEIELSYTVLTCQFEFDAIVNMGQRFHLQNPEGGGGNMLPSASVGGSPSTGPGVYQYSSGDFVGTITLQNPPDIGIYLENIQASFSGSQLSVSGNIVNTNNFAVKDLYVYWHITDGSGNYLSSWQRYGPGDGAAYSAEIPAQSTGTFSETMCCGNEGTVTPYIVQAFTGDGTQLIDVPIYVSDTPPITPLTINTLEIYETNEGYTRYHVIGDAPATTDLTFTLTNPDGEVDGVSSAGTGAPAYDHDGLIFEPFDGNWIIQVCAPEYDMCVEENFVIDQAPPPDTIPPVVVVPNNMAIEATSNNPSPVTFSVSASDDKDGPITPACTHASGSNFPIGVTAVTCTATDSAGNQSSESFTISITYDEPDSTEPQITIDEPYFDGVWKFQIEGSGFYPGIDGELQILDSIDWDNFMAQYVSGNSISIDDSGSFTTLIVLGSDENYIPSGNYDIIITDVEEHRFLENYLQLNDFDDLIISDFSTTEFKVNEEKILDITGSIDLIPEYGTGNEWLHVYIFKDNSGELSTSHGGTWSLDDIPDENGDFHMAINASFEQAGKYQPIFSFNRALIWGPVITVTEINETEPEPESITVRTSRSSYDEGDAITIIGNVSPPGTKDITLQIFTDGNLVDIAQVTQSSDGSFSHTVIAEGPLWNEDGDYLVRALYEELVAEDEFEFEVEDEYLPPIPEPEPEPTEVTIVPAAGSGAPGCEETADGCYIPSTARVVLGGVVIMWNTDTAAHTFTSGHPDSGPDGIFDTALLMAGGSYEWSPVEDGNYPYFCMVHPWMLGEIIVGEGGDTPTPIRLGVKTDKSFYHIGDDLEIKGVVKPYEGSNVILQIYGPSGNLVYDERIRPSSSGAFTDELKLAGSDYRNTGTYIVKSIYKSQSHEIQFTLQKETPYDIPKTDLRTQDEVTIVPVDGSGAPGCEDTSTGCYIPSVVSVSVGGTVIMKNTDTAAHTFTSGTPEEGPTGIFDTSLLMAGGSYEWSPRSEGEVPYFCMVHPWMVGTILVGEGTTRTQPEPRSDDHADLEVTVEQRVYDINSIVVMNIGLSGTDDAKGVAIDITDPRGTSIVSRSISVEPNQITPFEFKIDESSKTGNYKVTATASHSDRILKDTAHFKVKSQFNSFKIESVEITDQKGNPSDLEAGEIGFIKVNISSNKSIATLLTVNLFDSELTSIGIGSVQTTLSSGGSEIILSFNIPNDAALGPAEIYVNAFSDWPSEGGIPLTGEVSTTEDIE